MYRLAYSEDCSNFNNLVDAAGNDVVIDLSMGLLCRAILLHSLVNPGTNLCQYLAPLSNPLDSSQLSIIIIYSNAWSILIQQIKFSLSGDNLTWIIQNNLIKLKYCATIKSNMKS